MLNHRAYAYTSVMLGFAALFTSVQVRGQLADEVDGVTVGPYREYSNQEVGPGDTIKCRLSFPGAEQSDGQDNQEYSILDEQILSSQVEVESPQHIWVYEYDDENGMPTLIKDASFDPYQVYLTGSEEVEVTPYPLPNPESIAILDEDDGDGTKYVLFVNTLDPDLAMDCFIFDPREVVFYRDDFGNVVKKKTVKRKAAPKRKVAYKKAAKKAAASRRKAERKQAK